MPWANKQGQIDAFNVAFAAAYGNGVRGELENLGKLFSPAARNAYAQALAEGLVQGGSASVDVAWIDKRPIAILNAGDTGAELGDMMLVIHESYGNGPLESRACLLEVKQSPADPVPPVPVTEENESTKNQFKILSTWDPIHTLKKTATNKDTLLSNIVTKTGSLDAALAQAWYVAVKPPPSSGWVMDPWVAAPAIAGSEFDFTLGELFVACARGDSLTDKKSGKTIAVGRGFKLNHTLQTPYSWDALINTIIHKVAQQYRMPPKYYTWPTAWRYFSGIVISGVATGAIAQTQTYQSAPALLPAIVLLTAVTSLATLYFVWKLWRLVRRPVPTVEAADFDDDDGGARIHAGRFPILIFTVAHDEPETDQRG
ncbi:MAG TPA: hypothetical protein VGM81_25980 [Burkholderiaceae bacterium]